MFSKFVSILFAAAFSINGTLITAGIVGGGGVGVGIFNSGVGLANHFVSKDAAVAAKIAADAAMLNAEIARDKLEFEKEEAAKKKIEDERNNNKSDDESTAGTSNGIQKETYRRSGSALRSSKTFGSVKRSQIQQSYTRPTPHRQDAEKTLEGIEKMLKSIQQKKQPVIVPMLRLNSTYTQEGQATRKEAELDKALRKLRAEQSSSGHAGIPDQTKASTHLDNPPTGQDVNGAEHVTTAELSDSGEEVEAEVLGLGAGPPSTIDEIEDFSIGSTSDDGKGYKAGQVNIQMTVLPSILERKENCTSAGTATSIETSEIADVLTDHDITQKKSSNI